MPRHQSTHGDDGAIKHLNLGLLRLLGLLGLNKGASGPGVMPSKLTNIGNEKKKETSIGQSCYII